MDTRNTCVIVWTLAALGSLGCTRSVDDQRTKTFMSAPVARVAVAPAVTGTATAPTDGAKTVLQRVAASSNASANDFRRTVVLIYGETKPGQDMFIRGGLDHNQARILLAKTCTSTNYDCAVPIKYSNTKSATTSPWKQGDEYLDWYGRESGQTGVSHGISADGSVPDWTTNYWPESWGAERRVSVDGYGTEPLNRFGMHYWMLDVSMDCSRAFPSGDAKWFELKSYITNGPGWERDIHQAGAPYESKNHFAQCGMLNVFKRGEDEARFLPIATSDDPVLVGAGDIAYTSGGKAKTAALLDALVPSARAVFVAGDAIQIQPASAEETRQAYTNLFEPTWGRHQALIRPAPGNHDFWSAEEPYYEYFGPAAGTIRQGYYSYDLGSTWHVIVLNANNAVDERYTARLAGELLWLQRDLEAARTKRVVAYWHQPLFSSGPHGGDPRIKAYWSALAQFGNAEVVINGHDHIYERFARQNPSGLPDSSGIRQFVVGTGGMDLYPVMKVVPNSEVRIEQTWGVLKLALHNCWYEWIFIPVDGGGVDTGSTFCH